MFPSEEIRFTDVAWDAPVAYPWMEGAACTVRRTPDTWFPSRGDETRDAVLVCRGCPVAEVCLNYAMGVTAAGQNLVGIWGGTTERQRRAAVRRAAHP